MLELNSVVAELAALRAMPQPEMMEVDVLHRHAVGAEGMDVGMAEARPVDELDAELEAGLRGAHELDFVDPHGAVVVDDRRDRGFAHADGADLVGLDELDLSSRRP